jgi:ataxia telangiectasia mutated family protein
MVEMAFNVVLGDPVRQSFDDGKEREASTAPGTDMDDTGSLYLDDDLDEGDDDNENFPSTSTATQSKKRRRRDSSVTPLAGPSTSTPHHKAQKSHTPSSVTLEQVELTSLLAILLRSPSAPFLSPNFPYLPAAILHRLQRFLNLYPADTSLYHDYLPALSATLSHLSLNKKHDVETFARGAWDGLVGLWGTKNKGLKEGLVAVLRILFPFVTVDQDGIGSGCTWGDGIGRLWHLLDGEAESRWGVDGLSFESLRLEVVSEVGEDADERAVFVASTFRAGWHFDASQALAWAILELQANCAERVTYVLFVSEAGRY